MTFNFLVKCQELTLCLLVLALWCSPGFAAEPEPQFDQDSIPLELSIQTQKDTFKIGESIEFVVILKNRSNRSFQVRKLNDKTLFLLYDNKPWGTKKVHKRDLKDTRYVLLEPHQVIRQRFVAEGMRAPKEFEIICSYNMTFQGAQPTARLILKVVKN